MSRPKHAGFSLIELLVVVSIIALLIAILLPALWSSRTSAMELQCQSNLSGLVTGQSAHCLDNDNFFPPAMRWVWSEGKLPKPGERNMSSTPTGATFKNDPTSIDSVLNGILIDYYTVREAYVCPVADEVLPKLENYWKGEKLMRSYVQNNHMGKFTGGGSDRKFYDEETLDSVASPSYMVVNAEENSFATPYNFHQGWTGMNDGHFIATRATSGVDSLGSFHKTTKELLPHSVNNDKQIYKRQSPLASGVSFASMVDGHVEEVNYKSKMANNAAASAAWTKDSLEVNIVGEHNWID